MGAPARENASDGPPVIVSSPPSGPIREYRYDCKKNEDVVSDRYLMSSAGAQSRLKLSNYRVFFSSDGCPDAGVRLCPRPPVIQTLAPRLGLSMPSGYAAIVVIL